MRQTNFLLPMSFKYLTHLKISRDTLATLSLASVPSSMAVSVFYFVITFAKYD